MSPCAAEGPLASPVGVRGRCVTLGGRSGGGEGGMALRPTLEFYVFGFSGCMKWSN
jgi:hypothetical protein